MERARNLREEQTFYVGDGRIWGAGRGGAGEGRSWPSAARGAPIHLPTWSRLNVAAKQSAPAGNGGDFFEVIQQRDGRVAVVVADVCGNGPSAAAPVSGLRWILRQEIARGAAPGGVLAALNDWMFEQQIDDRFVTAVCVRIDAVTGLAEIASAGHLGPFVKRAAGGAEDLPRAVGLALGILPAQIYPETIRRAGAGGCAGPGDRRHHRSAGDRRRSARTAARSWSGWRARGWARRASAARCSAPKRAPPKTPLSWWCSCRGATAAPPPSPAPAGGRPSAADEARVGYYRPP